MSANKKISLIMPTYNREFIIELAVLSIIHQKEHNWKIELLIGEEKEETSTEENKEETGEMPEEEANEEKSDGKKNNTKEVSANQTEEIKPEGEPSSE